LGYLIEENLIAGETIRLRGRQDRADAARLGYHYSD
jgi:hypothetical protein